ncbi:DUF2332 domain-containing protein [Sphingomonas sanxanigenens]|uniref:DUF2332 domain-containing protein n=1 Tax=Sphingomonas sanxanigenens DSM 19645 = NX02 TaxID=1123269 RepID=W0AJ63_9SPHN|nr:DUF2332 domain-containing protein [Sphingomonas sanxanigenens]AHE57166.1 hypothetical protein NX02_27915 [Sphingomonas sanxanigenens DSM 19645 = NX02]
MADEHANRAAFEVQAQYCDANDAPITALLCRGIARTIDDGSGFGRAILGWPGAPIADGLALRAAAGFHAVWRDGRAAPLDALFAGVVQETAQLAAALCTIVHTHDAELTAWLDSPPQTNEPGRSAGLMSGLLVLAARFGLPFDLLEIGSSAGLNLLIDRFAFDLGGVRAGSAGSPVPIRPDWRGPPPPIADVRIDSVRGVDIRPIDATAPGAERRLLAYIWADHRIRFDRVSRAIAMIRARPVDLVQGDAADWVEAALARPQVAGTMRVLMHSIVWQYLPAEGQARIAAAMAAAGAEATEDRPLGWVTLEADRTLNRHDLVVRTWPGDGAPVLLAHAHAHGFWVEWVTD